MYRHGTLAVYALRAELCALRELFPFWQGDQHCRRPSALSNDLWSYLFCATEELLHIGFGTRDSPHLFQKLP
jgi:hypothetical protein